MRKDSLKASTDSCSKIQEVGKVEVRNSSSETPSTMDVDKPTTELQEIMAGIPTTILLFLFEKEK